MMKRLITYLLICVAAVSCHGNLDPNEDKGGTDLPEGVDTTVNLASGYARKMVAMQFTSVGCTYCPILADALKDVQRNRPGEIVPVAFHLDYGGFEDPMALPVNTKFYNKVTTGEGLPLFALNFRKSSQHIVNEYAKIISEIDLQKKNHPAVCGVAVSTEFDPSSRKLKVNAWFTSDVARQYRYHILLVEDGIEYMQAGSDEDSYIHNNVLRLMAGDNILGSKLNGGEYVEPGKEYEVSKTLTLEEGWNHENMRVVVAALDTRDGGDNYYCNNVNVCAVGKSADYCYEGDVVVESRFEKNVCVMEFTGTWCAQCPEGAVTLNYLVSRAYKDQAYALAFHNDDPYSLPAEQELKKMFNWAGYPAYVVDMRKDGVGSLNEGGCGSEIEESLYDIGTHCGVSVSSVLKDGEVSVDAKVFSELAMEYRIAAYVIEDKIVGEQMQGTGTVQDDYVHRHVVRKMLSADVRGDKLGNLAPEEEKTVTFGFAVEEEWNTDNLSVAVLAIDEDGHVNNMAVCAADGGKMDYEYVK